VRLEEQLPSAADRRCGSCPLTTPRRLPGLLADALRDGRVLVDGDGLWGRLKRREPSVRRGAKLHDQELLKRALRPLEANS
jgi:hypothetical protein